MAAKEIALTKRMKISQAQQYMILAVLATGVIVGVSLSITLHFIQTIGFNARIIMAKDEAIVAYSDTIKNVGVCKSPKGKVYTAEELKKCDPGMVNVDDVPNTLRSNILGVLAANESLNSVPKEAGSGCINSETGKAYTYDELNERYNNASSSEEIASATNLIKSCSALRLIPDALPSQGNEEALLASLNKIFIDSGWTPETLSPSGSSPENKIEGINSLEINLALETDAQTVYTVLDNIEHSVREFNIQQAMISSNASTLSLSAKATAYWVEPTALQEVQKTIKFDESKKGKK